MDIQGCIGKYQCSNLGNFRKINKDKRSSKYRILKGCINPRGYVHVYIKGIKTLLAHRIIAKTFLLSPNNDCVIINHKNLNKADNRVENLEWCTASENTKHAYSIGLMKPKNGSINGNSKKLIDTKTNKIFDTVNEAAEYLNMKRPTLSNMLTGFRRNKTNLRYL